MVRLQSDALRRTLAADRALRIVFYKCIANAWPLRAAFCFMLLRSDSSSHVAIPLLIAVVETVWRSQFWHAHWVAPW